MITNTLRISILLACTVGFVGCKTSSPGSASDVASHGSSSSKIKNMYDDAAMTSASKSEFAIKSDWDEVDFSKDGFSLSQNGKDEQSGNWDDVTNPADASSMAHLQSAIAAVQVLNERLASFDNKDIQNMKPSAKDLLLVLNRMASAKSASEADKADLDGAIKDLFSDMNKAF